jgi:glucose-6-phosphate-specific signal transduction histidine kinase
VLDRLNEKLAAGARTGVFLTALVIILLALAIPGWGGALLVTAVVGIMAVITRRTWRVQDPRTRVMRVAILALMLAIAYLKAR